jgi:signal peptidase II
MFKFLWIVAVVGIADQVTKYFALLHLRNSDIVVTPFLKFSLAFNTGAAFSFLSDRGDCDLDCHPVHDPAPGGK